MSHLFTQIWQGGSKENYSILQRNWVTHWVEWSVFVCKSHLFLISTLTSRLLKTTLPPSLAFLSHTLLCLSTSFLGPPPPYLRFVPFFLFPSFHFFSTFSKLLPSFWVLAKRLDELRTWLWKSLLSLKPEIHVIWSLNDLNFPHSSPATVKKPCHLVPFLM